ncbi:MAG: ribosome small subunit-dependent GTPase A [Lentimicrobium sp.]|nr:ribosome small subunit-dependent GTPase A [Lentimicrobium sp.]
MDTYKGVVIRSTGSWCTVLSDNGKLTECKLKGNFRIKGIRSTNPLAVGDKVEFIFQQDIKIGLIHTIADRFNYIIRKATRLSAMSHIIAANIDQAVVMVTLSRPRTSTGFIDRFLVTAEAYHIPAFLIFNKCDQYTEAEMIVLNKMIDLYSGLGYPCFKTSALFNQGIEEVNELLRAKVSLVAGHSGVGKTALINVIEPGVIRKVGEISEYHHKGKHTTTFAEMIPLSNGGFVIDTPGIKEFGLVNFDKQEVPERFPEMRNLMHKCQFNNCTHVHEPGCAVKSALAKGLLSQSRYSNYISIINDEYFEETEWD